MQQLLYTLHTSTCLTFSPVIANGVLNHCSNVATDLNMVGNRKLSRAHNSGRLFCMSPDTGRGVGGGRKAGRGRVVHVYMYRGNERQQGEKMYSVTMYIWLFATWGLWFTDTLMHTQRHIERENLL